MNDTFEKAPEERSESEFEIVSFHEIGTHAQDLDEGVVRLGRDFALPVKRGQLVRIQSKKTGKAIVRVVRRGVGKSHLDVNQIAMQYDDKVLLGLSRDKKAELEFKVLGNYIGILRFFRTHPSPLIRLEAMLAWIMLVLGSLIGGILGFLIGFLLP